MCRRDVLHAKELNAVRIFVGKLAEVLKLKVLLFSAPIAADVLSTP
jgi:hypothetical protein